MKGRAGADGEQHNAMLESQLWLLSGLVQGSREARSAVLKCLPDLVHLLDAGTAYLPPMPLNPRNTCYSPLRDQVQRYLGAFQTQNLKQ